MGQSTMRHTGRYNGNAMVDLFQVLLPFVSHIATQVGQSTMRHTGKHTGIKH